MSAGTVKISLAQTSAILGDVARNVAHHVELAERALRDGAEAIVFPELSLTGYLVRDINYDVALDPATSPLLKSLRELSRKISIICGGVELDSGGGVFNSAFLFEEGELRATHRKIYPPTYGLFEEMRYFSRGTRLRAFDSARLGRIGLLVCEDLWHPALPYLLAQDGARILITIAASPTRLATGTESSTGRAPANYELNREHHATFARLFGIFMIFVNRVGVEDGVNFWGGSEVVAPNGVTVRLSRFFEEDLESASIDLGLVLRARQFSRHPLDEDLALTSRFFEEIFNRTRGVQGPEWDLSSGMLGTADTSQIA